MHLPLGSLPRTRTLQSGGGARRSPGGHTSALGPHSTWLENQPGPYSPTMMSRTLTLLKSYEVAVTTRRDLRREAGERALPGQWGTRCLMVDPGFRISWTRHSPEEYAWASVLSALSLSFCICEVVLREADVHVSAQHIVNTQLTSPLPDWRALPWPSPGPSRQHCTSAAWMKIPGF